ncbi:MAG TPA: DUF1329 domain-containing protein [Candidatus Binatia bacterium]|jgi:hypothetical protein|nr:DUF1329 domain-containing protein [Candidatus Binatia bacterium]
MRIPSPTWLAVVACLLGAAVAGAGEEVAPGLGVGDVLGPDNADRAQELLPPEIVKHYAAGEYRNPIVTYAPDGEHWEAAFLAATKKNATTLDTNEAGTIIDRATGRQPEYVYGLPFPDIDPKDPKAAIKIVWNQFYAYWNHGNTFNKTRVIMLQPKGVDRDIVADGYFKFFDGQAEKYREKNPLNLQSQFLGVSTFPADLQGTASLTWRYRDSHKRDSVWAYVPALRRVRAVSPTDRSDGYLGSDISGDDGFFFDGKPEDFTWELVGKRDALRVVDPKSVSGELTREAVKGGGWVTVTRSSQKMAGFEDPAWRGISWAPITSALAKRPVWVVRATPRDRYYLYGKLELWIDAITWDGSWNRKFDWRDQLVAEYQTMARVNHPAGPEDAREWLPLNTLVWACAENFRLNRATLGGMRPFPDAPFYARVPINPNIFDANSLVHYGK